jgi:hypothetical protein
MKYFNGTMLLAGLLFVATPAQSEIRNPNYDQADSVDTEEIYIRLTTEDLTNAEKLRLIQGPAKAMKLRSRVQYYASVLGGLKRYKLPVSVEIALLKRAMVDAEQIEYTPSARNGFSTPVENLVRHVGEWSANHQTSHRVAAREFLARIFKMQGVTENMFDILALQFTSWAKKNQAYPDFEFVMENVIRSPRFTTEHAVYRVLETLQKFQPPYMARSRLLSLVANSGKLDPIRVKLAAELSHKYLLSAQFFARIKAVKTDQYYAVNTKQVALDAIRSDGAGPYLFSAVYAWLKSNSTIPAESQSEVVFELLKNSRRVGVPGFSLSNDVLSQLRPYLFLPVSESIQREILNFFFDRTLFHSDGTESIRYRLASGLIYNWDKNNTWPLPLTQWALKQLMQFTRGARSDTSNPSFSGNLTVELVLDALESCQNPEYPGRQADFDNKFCNAVPSRTELYQAIIDNPTVSSELRDRAARLKDGSAK